MLSTAASALRRSLRLRRPVSWSSAVRHTPSVTARLFSSGSVSDPTAIRNVAVIAHVDHGKTTLMDMLLKACDPTSRAGEEEDRVMDSMALEQERGITIVSKVTSMQYKGTKINIVDTPGHADFGGEVERVLSMVDGVLLVVDANEGPNTQTRFVTRKALERGLRPIVVLNKADRLMTGEDGSATVAESEDNVFDLLVALNATDDQLDFPFIYASARDGWAVEDFDERPQSDSEVATLVKNPEVGMAPLLDKIVEFLPPPETKSYPDDLTPDQLAAAKAADFSMLVSMIGHDTYMGRLVTGRVYGGSVKVGQQVKVVEVDEQRIARAKDGTSQVIETQRVTKLLGMKGSGETFDIEEAHEGDIVRVAGLSAATVNNAILTHTPGDKVNNTRADVAKNVPKLVDAVVPIDPPTIAMTFSANSSPLSGKDGTKLTSQIIGQRLIDETETNVSLQIEKVDGGAYTVKGRGELQMGVLIETMRREGFELSVSPPVVLFQEDENGKVLEPFERVVVDVQEEHVGGVMENLCSRQAEMLSMSNSDDGRTRMEFLAPSRALVGYVGMFQLHTRGTGILNKVFDSYRKHCGKIAHIRPAGVLISNATGKSNAYALQTLEDRGTLFIPGGVDVYEGMIVGEHSRDKDLVVNPIKSKQLTNVRASGTDEAIRLTPHRTLTLEEALGYVAPDELVEVTPSHIRLRKLELSESKRKAGNRSRR